MLKDGQLPPHILEIWDSEDELGKGQQRKHNSVVINKFFERTKYVFVAKFFQNSEDALRDTLAIDNEDVNVFMHEGTRSGTRIVRSLSPSHTPRNKPMYFDYGTFLEDRPAASSSNPISSGEIQLAITDASAKCIYLTTFRYLIFA